MAAQQPGHVCRGRLRAAHCQRQREEERPRHLPGELRQLQGSHHLLLPAGGRHEPVSERNATAAAPGARVGGPGAESDRRRL